MKTIVLIIVLMTCTGISAQTDKVETISRPVVLELTSAPVARLYKRSNSTIKRALRFEVPKQTKSC